MIDSSHLTLAIILMACITFIMRYVFFMKILHIQLNDTIKTILSFTAPCILTAMLVPIMFQDMLAINKDILSVFSSAYFLAGVCTVVLSLFVRNALLVIIISMVIFYALRTIL